MNRKLKKMSFSKRPAPIYYHSSPQFHRGVFAARALRKGEVIEVSPTIPVDPPSGLLADYVFDQNNQRYVAFGCASMINHSSEPNVTWDFNRDHDIVLKAIHTINKHDELFIDYGAPYWQDRPNTLQ